MPTNKKRVRSENKWAKQTQEWEFIVKHLHQLYFTSLFVLPSPCFSAISSSVFKRMFSSPEMEKTDIHSPSCPFTSFPTLFFHTKKAEMRQNFSTTTQTTESWQIPTKCTQMDITASYEIQDYIANCLQ